VGKKSEVCHAANNATGKIKEHVSRKGVGQTCEQGPLGREGAPLMISGVFAVALSWMHIRIRCPIIQVRLSEVHNKTTNGLTFQQPFLEQVLLVHDSVVPWLCHWPLLVDGSEVCFFPRPGSEVCIFPRPVGFWNGQFEESGNVRTPSELAR